MTARRLSDGAVGRLHHGIGERLSVYPQFSVSGGAVIPLEQIAVERFHDLRDFLLGAALILKQILDAAPGKGSVRFALEAVVEEFTVLLTGVLVEFSAVNDFHLGFPSVVQGVGCRESRSSSPHLVRHPLC